MMASSGPDPAVLTPIASTDVAWYGPDLESRLIPTARKLFKTYVGLPSDKVEPHLHKIVSTPSSPLTSFFIHHQTMARSIGLR